ncbi:MarR family transcriptional regulator [Ethanoligenens harbinense]|nr:MarR family transcriptional regulator [Ethanoligenens harbinense YUAN-3]AYF39216.1 MarR family transcriptional regulator [Ethanoligenens harbinense]AYF42040.1 MarR family transcriptional regulator [Ethanoligenens harbinense]QCN92795.1 MarR family transcriptional regulator [Ethanoligenens harbinense]
MQLYESNTGFYAKSRLLFTRVLYNSEGTARAPAGGQRCETVDSEQFIGRYISMLYRFRKSFMSRRLGDFGRVAGLYVFLLTLERHDGQNQEQISERLGIDKATTCKALQKLERQGYVRREVDERDRRAYRVYLAKAGHAVLPAIRGAIREWDALVTAELTEEEEQVLSGLLRRLAEKARGAISDPPRQES